ncbi:hypothetical protein P7C70_g1088, partial [Phenoliferia sp. Uapishka_3]
MQGETTTEMDASESQVERERGSSGTNRMADDLPPEAYKGEGGYEFGVHGMHRSSSSLEIAPQLPTLSGGIARRMSLSSSEDENEERDEFEDEKRQEKIERNRPLKFRSESLPIFPPVEVDEVKATGKVGMSVADLPTNPKLWMPSHLSVYLAHTLNLHRELEKDITSFVRSSRLSGRGFLRLRDDDMESMGINIRWRPILSEARDRLRREALGGKIWGFEGVRHGDSDPEGGGSPNNGKRQSVIGLMPPEDEDKDAWKNSWRKTPEGKSRGRVKGMAQAFEAPPLPSLSTSLSSTSLASQTSKRSSIVVPSATGAHGRSDSMNSTTSSASIDSGDGSPKRSPIDATTLAGKISPFDFDVDPPVDDELFSSPDSSADVLPKDYQSNIAAHHKDDARPYGLVRRPSAPVTRGRGNPRVDSTMVRGADGRMSVHDIAFTVSSPQSPQADSNDTEESDGAEPTIKSGGRPSLPKRGKSGLEELFGIDTRRSELEVQKMVDGGGDDDDLMSMHVGGKKGSMIFVKKSQLESLQKKLEEVEAKLAEVLATQASDRDSASEHDEMTPAPANLGSWILKSFNRNSDHSEDRFDPGAMSWTGLGGYCIAASIGIGIIAGEVVVSKLFGFGTRR